MSHIPPLLGTIRLLAPNQHGHPAGHPLPDWDGSLLPIVRTSIAAGQVIQGSHMSSVTAPASAFVLDEIDNKLTYRRFTRVANEQQA